jgi:hypothetical protein
MPHQDIPDRRFEIWSGIGGVLLLAAVVDRGLGVLLEGSAAAMSRDPQMPARILAGDQDRQLERIGEADPKKLPRCRLGDGQVAAFDSPPEDAQCMALRGRRSSPPGPDGWRVYRPMTEVRQPADCVP